ncbi:MAG: efflux RND transporter periplasmic adaptor subunit [Paraglaciecola sp.]|nr:efflux RND transporter periplasmic adaptor subunit [Paraglaciecola sp.]NCT46722.1 efflux RND transporter periplasmic adaptor subunit [Paraglaciecola sp.]
MNDKSELLQQLKIDRQAEPTAKAIGLWWLLLIILGVVAITIWLTLLLVQPKPTVQNSAATSPVKLSSQASTSRETINTTSGTTQLKSNDSILNSSGYITARRMATVSSEVMGLITDVDVEEGMTVQQGQILAHVDDALAKVNFDYATAQLAVLAARRQAIVANLDEAKSAYQRVLNNTYSSDAERTRTLASQQSLVANLAAADADLQVAKIEVRRQQELLDNHTIRAPFAGVVTQKNAQPGEIVAPSSAGGGFTRTGICTIVDMESLEIEVDVNESFIGRVFPGQKVEATLDAYPDWVIPASVIATIPTADRAKATVQVRIKIEVNDPRILPDMGVKVGFLKD